uniref:NADH-ubiquinone oxidoreductase chain 3 n=1 Tax=Dipseliopoda sp. AJB-2020 TaxID=2721793 RepID=A0A7D3QQE4_9MUSC|nr:NADH dehydrogenase subunit 3 [Dipseliopoda sp. AJB-2020]
MIISMLTINILLFLMSLMILIISWILSKKKYMDREKSSPFECGFDPNKSSRIPFSLHFFLITVMFLIFDVEITLILPMILSFMYSNMLHWTLMSIMFLMILLIGLFHEWKMEMLNWL